MIYQFHREAKRELREAILYYHYKDPNGGLGMAFNDLVRESYPKISSHPPIYRDRGDGLRRKNLGRFPDYLSFVILETGHLLILTVAHSHSKPDDWKNRVSSVP